MNCIRRATRDDAPEINSLRLAEYSRAKEFTLVEPALLTWNERDDQDVVLAAWDERRHAISTMRGGIARDRRQAEDKLKCTLADDYLFPSLILDRAATSKDHRGGGLNSALRYYFFFSILGLPVFSVLGAVYEHAPRVKTMEELGYRISTLCLKVQTHVQSDLSLFVTYLEHSKIRDACDRLRVMAQSPIADYPWCGDPLEFKL